VALASGVLQPPRVTPTFLVLPGIYSSGPEHWQTRWEQLDARFRRVQQDDWDHPRPQAWVARIVDAVESAEGGVVFVAHSLGCHAVAYAAREQAVRDRVVAAFLVAPPDLYDPRNDHMDLAGFRPPVLDELPFPSTLVASTDDQTCRLEHARELAAAWGSELVVAGALGHINSDSSLGDWPVGREILDRLLDRLTLSRPGGDVD
jgi:uncharacterized protein